MESVRIRGKKLASLLLRISFCLALPASGFLISRLSAFPQSQSTAGPARDQSAPSSSKEPAGTGQDSGPAPPVRVNTRLVQINVIVNDKRGNPIAGLTKEDFVLLDNKKPQEIQVFSSETNLPTDQPSSPLPVDTYSNQLAQSVGGRANLTVILFDALNTQFADQSLSRKQVLRFLDQLRPQDRVALYWLGDKLYVLSDFTTDAPALRAALARPAPNSDENLAESDPSYLTLNNPNPSTPGGQTYSREAFRSAFDQRVANQSVKNRVRLTLAALAAIARHLSALQGRKNLVWVSGSFPLTLGQDRFDLNWENDTGENFKGEVARTTQALTDANLAVYPVDARGILGSGLTAGGDYSEGPPPEFAGQDSERLPSRVAPGNLDTMKTLAERTGGRAFYGSNDVSDAIRRALDDSRVTYTLGFYPSFTKWDGSFHTIKVKAKSPGSEVRSRTGYFAIPDSARTPPQSIQTFVQDSSISQLDATAIGMRAQVHSANLAEQLVALELHLNLRDIQTKMPDGQWRGSFQLVFLQLDNRGQTIHATDETVQVSLTQAAYERAQNEGLRNDRQIQVRTGAVRLCILVRDPATGSIGSLSIPLEKYLPRTSPPAN